MAAGQWTIRAGLATALAMLGTQAPAQTAQTGHWGILTEVIGRSSAGTLRESGTLAHCSGSRYAGYPVEKACGYTEVKRADSAVFSQYFDGATDLAAKQHAYSSYAVRYLDGQYHWEYGQGDATAAADLADGTLRFTTLGIGGGNVGGGGYGGAFIRMDDTITFAGLTKPIEIGFDIRVDGTFELEHQPRFGFQFYNPNSSLDGTRLTAYVPWAAVNGTTTSTDTPGALYAGVLNKAGNWTTLGPNRFVGSVWIDPLNPVYFFEMSLSGGGRGVSDFGHTAQIGWTLPEGVTYSSASGAFLTGRAGAVPEPGTWAMLVLGFCLAGSALRARRAWGGSVRATG